METDPNFEAAVNRLRELNERVIEAGRNAGNVYLDLYERTLKTIAEYGESAAGASQIDVVSSLARTQAEFLRQVAETSASVGREFLQAGERAASGAAGAAADAAQDAAHAARERAGAGAAAGAKRTTRGTPRGTGGERHGRPD
jgi:hypothetical protein